MHKQMSTSDLTFIDGCDTGSLLAVVLVHFLLVGVCSGCGGPSSGSGGPYTDCAMFILTILDILLKTLVLLA